MRFHDRCSVLQVTNATDSRAAGIREAIEGLINSLAEHGGIELTVIGILQQSEKWAYVPKCNVRRILLESSGPRSFSYAPGVESAALLAGANIVHFHGLLQYASTVASRALASAADRPATVLSPHGMFAAPAIAHKQLRKWLATLLYQRQALGCIDAFHVTSRAECDDVRAAGWHQPVAIIPFGVEVPADVPKRVDHSPRTALFLSRIHPIKGIVDLVAAWGAARPKNWRLVIAGPDECGHLREVIRTIERYGLGDTVHVRGAAWGQDKLALFADSDLFILPSRSENFGIVIAEALASGLPVITTRGTPWEVISTAQCGWYVAAGVGGLVPAIREACSLGCGELTEMGLRGRQLMEKCFSWSATGSNMCQFYDWLCGQRTEPPAFVDFAR